MNNNCFIRYKRNIQHIPIPQQFTFPFNYEPHKLAIIAAKELQEHLKTQTDWTHDFGIEHYSSATNVGKMFGILVVKNRNNELGYLAAFSGKIAGTNQLPHFVPPIFNLQEENGFFSHGEKELNTINAKILYLENHKNRRALIDRLNDTTQKSQDKLQQFRIEMKAAKALRKLKRENAKSEINEEAYSKLVEVLKNESLKYQYDYKVMAKEFKTHIASLQKQLNEYDEKINTLKQLRKTKSADLQKQLFDQYRFLNIRHEECTASEIFKNTTLMTPPAGTGECAAPKLLQYAFTHNLDPVCMCEFWWGQSPKSAIRKHGNFYPSCKSKCEPILKHMLKGMNVETNPTLLLPKPQNELDIIFEDAYLLIVNKPHNFLSVPGNIDTDSIYTRIKTRYPEATGPLIVHRLDMSTSGLLIIAKTKEVHKDLQLQFLNREVKKRYIAILDGIIKEDEGYIKLPLRVDLDNRPQQLVCYDYGKPAVTKWKKIQIENSFTRVYFYPYTGRTHQLRVHAAHPDGLNTPIVGDDIYGTHSNRLHLHAEYINFKHPVTGKKISFRVDPDF